MHVVATLLFGGANVFEFAVACEVFGLERPEFDGSWYEHRLCGVAPTIALSGGASMALAHGLEALADADTVLVPNAPRGTGAIPTAACDALRAAHARGARMVSFCTGAFALAEAGILDGRKATTHWMHADEFRQRYPRVHLDPNVLYVDEGDVLTSAGTAAGIDLALHIVRMDHGAEAARIVARRMVVPPHRDGGQAQYIDPPHQPVVPGDELAGLLDRLSADVDRQVTVEDMAAQVAMSPRTFARRFKETTGTTPYRWLLTQRLHRAQQLLETSDLDVDQIADRSGFGTAANLRLHFRRELRTTPTSYRRTFRHR